MKKHVGMRPQDIVVLLKIIALGEGDWLGKDLAIALRISTSEVSQSLQRSHFAGLIDVTKRDFLAIEEPLAQRLRLCVSI